jgi:flagellar biosynthesis protein FliR
MIVNEALIGLALGFVMQIVMHVFILTGQFISLKIGLGFAAQNDPSSGVSVTVVSQFYLLLSTLLFLAIDGHLALIQMLVNSFSTFPIGGRGLRLSTSN